jgi:hypothetical protein
MHAPKMSKFVRCALEFDFFSVLGCIKIDRDIFAKL